MSIEAVEAVLPGSSGVLGPYGDLDQRLRPQSAWPPLSISAATDQTRLLEDLQMTGDGREADREGFGQLESLTASWPVVVPATQAPRRRRSMRPGSWACGTVQGTSRTWAVVGTRRTCCRRMGGLGLALGGTMHG